MEDRKLPVAKKIARSIGADVGARIAWQSLEISDRAGKRFKIKTPSGKLVHFGQWPYNGQGTFIDHKDPDIRRAWKARHEKIKLKSGESAYLNKESPSYYAYHILW
jgi:hypothetical protein